MSIRSRFEKSDTLIDTWFHSVCFWDFAQEEQVCEGNIRGIEFLRWEDQENIRQKIVEPKEKPQESSPAKTPASKSESEEKNKFYPLFAKAEKRKSIENGKNVVPEKKTKVDTAEDEFLVKLKQQTETLWRIRQELSEKLSSDEVDSVLQKNGRYRRKSDNLERRVEQLADCIVFGVPANCAKCKKGVLFYSWSKHVYRCNRNVTKYSRCQHEDRYPPRTVIKTAAIKSKLPVFKNPLNQRYYSPGIESTVTKVSSTFVDKIKAERRALESETIEEKRAYLKNGCTVDGNCEVAKIAHVFIDNYGTAFQAFLNSADVAQNRNSFYKLQLLKHDKKEIYYLYRSWGRIGTKGGNKTQFFGEKFDNAKKEFETLFLEKSKNEWQNRRNFEKKPGCFDYLEMEIDKESNKKPKFDVETSKSLLPKPIKNLIGSIFNIHTMEETLKAFNIDLEKMPLGKISQQNIKKAMHVLKELEMITHNASSSSDTLDASNRFYNLIPHACGSESLPLLNNDEIIHQKTKLLDDLSQIEIAYSIIEADEKNDDEDIDPVDKHYEKLHCKIEVLPRESEDYEVIESYISKTHAPTHSNYSLQILDAFKIAKESEHVRFKKDIGNRNLLWHGSRTSNFAGILSQGLRIAPPEAPVNGYMFGKGIYFADMVSKSANYCGVSDGEGYLLLCEVALGEIQEEKNANERIRKPLKGKSSVKGLGLTFPDDSDRRIIEDDIIVPIGEPTKDKHGLNDYSLLYNEYIVYDEAQVKMKYLIRAKFNMK
uniref:Poly [ADP-ribose] polymerase n=1 Tax=Panagrolaimus superbus TaxID=310955 RepID=A0A914YF33_9BILA